MQADQEEADVIVVSSKVWETMESWGYGDTKMLQDGEFVKDMELLRMSDDGQPSIWKADIHVKTEIPDNIILVGSKSRKGFSRVTISD
jgi:hypothetical protein